MIWCCSADAVTREETFRADHASGRITSISGGPNPSRPRPARSATRIFPSRVSAQRGGPRDSRPPFFFSYHRLAKAEERLCPLRGLTDRRPCAGRARGRLVRDHVRSLKIVLERELRRELQLARVEYRSRRAEQGVGNGRSGQRASGDLQVLNRPGDVIVVAHRDQAIAEVVGAVN